MKKYICMREDCDFCTSDEENAYEHAHMRKGHEVIEIDTNSKEEPTCHRLEIPVSEETEYAGEV